jgi:hypothetical protein
MQNAMTSALGYAIQVEAKPASIRHWVIKPEGCVEASSFIAPLADWASNSTCFPELRDPLTVIAVAANSAPAKNKEPEP